MFQLPSTQRFTRRNEHSQVCARRKIVPNSIYSARQLCCRMCGSPAVEHSHHSSLFYTFSVALRNPKPRYGGLTFGKRSGHGTKEKKILDSRSTASCLVSERGVSVFVAVICFPFADGTVRMSESRKCSNLRQLSNSNTVRARNRFAALCSITVD